MTLYPFWFVIQASVTDTVYRINILWPKGLYCGNYYIVFSTKFMGGGLIPFCMLLKTVGLLDTFWVFVFPMMAM